MTNLRILPVPLVAGEPLASLVSRLAARNAGGHPAQLADLIGIPWQEVVDATDRAREAIARQIGQDPATIGDAGARRVGARSFLVGGEPVPRLFLRRSRILACTACLRDDHAEHGGRPETVCAQRAAWQIEHVRTCPVHGRSLVEIATAATPHELGDFAEAVKRIWPDIDAIAHEAVARPASPLETYLLDRIAGRPGPAWLDANTLYGAARACEMLGAVARHGAHVLTDTLDDEAWYAAGAAGVAIARGGEESIRAFLAHVRAACPSDAGQIGLRAIFGSLHEWLAHGDGIGEAGPLREILRRFVIDTMPFGPGDVVMGERVATRSVHSVYTLHKATGAHPKRLRKILVDVGLVAAEDERSDHLVTFPAAPAEALARRVAAGIPLKKVETYLNCPRVHTRLLEERGFITPILDAEHRGRLAKHAFDPGDLDGFLDRLLGHAMLMAVPGEGMAPIPAAAKRACCSSMEIVGLVLDGRLQNLGRDPATRGYLSLLVDVEEIKPLVRLDIEPVGVSLAEVEKRLKTSHGVVLALISSGPNGEPPILESRVVVNAVNRCPQTVVPFEAMAAFEQEYVGLMQLAKEAGVHFRTLKANLEAEGVEPAFQPGRVGARFYERSLLPF